MLSSQPRKTPERSPETPNKHRYYPWTSQKRSSGNVSGVNLLKQTQLTPWIGEIFSALQGKLRIRFRKSPSSSRDVWRLSGNATVETFLLCSVASPNEDTKVLQGREFGGSFKLRLLENQSRKIVDPFNAGRTDCYFPISAIRRYCDNPRTTYCYISTL